MASLRRSALFLLPALLAIACSSGAGEPPEADTDDLKKKLDAGTSDAPANVDASTTGRVGVNDVSILFPLPKSGEDGLLLKLDAHGAKGALLPTNLYDGGVLYDGRVNFLWEGPGRENGYAWSRILAVRLDPCAGQTVITNPSTCHAEVRLSAQPLSGDEGMTSTIDAAIHLIYEVSRTELDAMFHELLALRTGSSLDVSALPLGPHPIMVQQGLGGAFATGVKRVVLSHVGASNLVKFTIVDRGRNSTNWRFHQNVKGPNGFAQTVIPTLEHAGSDASSQGLNELGIPGPEGGTRQSFVAPIDESVGYPKLLWNSQDATGATPTQIKAALRRLASFEDPGKFSAHTLDCVSCHVGANARDYYERATGVATPSTALTFKAPAGQNVTRVDGTKRSAHAIRALGYFNDQVAISQRTINESARVADWFAHGIR